MSTVSVKGAPHVVAILLPGLGLAALAGPVPLVAALLAVTVGLMLQLRLAGSLVIAVAGVLVGFGFHGVEGWGQIPMSVSLPPTLPAADWPSLARLLLDGQAWRDLGPLGFAAGGLILAIKEAILFGPGRSIAKRSLQARVNPTQAQVGPPGSLIGVDRTSGEEVVLSDEDANTHTLVLGTTGSGKTVTVLNLVESAINRTLPAIIIDGKGDQALARKVIDYGRAKGRPGYLFALSGESCRYNPLASGGYSAKKDRIIELREWSEDHYRKLAEGYMQTVFKVLEAVDIKTDLVTVAGHMSTGGLQALIRKHVEQLGEARAQALSDEVEAQKPAEAHVESLRAEIRNLAWSEVGHLFAVAADGPGAAREGDDGSSGSSTAEKPGSAVLELSRAIEERAVVYVCLPSLQFPALADIIGKLVINDLKAVAHEQLAKPEAERRPVYTVFDEFSVFAGEQVLNVINMGRSAGLHAVLATQSVADIGRAVPMTPDHFIRQVFASCNNYLIQRLNAPEDAVTVAELIGTKANFSHTAQIGEAGSTGWGSVRRTRSFQVHPDQIKQLKRGEAVFVNKTKGTLNRLKVRYGAIGQAS